METVELPCGCELRVKLSTSDYRLRCYTHCECSYWGRPEKTLVNAISELVGCQVYYDDSSDSFYSNR